MKLRERVIEEKVMLCVCVEGMCVLQKTEHFNEA